LEFIKDKMEKPILSIAIPTYNRSCLLDIALQNLLPQIVKHKKKIELIISDNFSDDCTQAIIKKNTHKFKGLRFISYIQKSNTGYYGNFKICKQFANGEYLWILSDNEFINIGLIDEIIILLMKNPNIFAIHLNDWQNYKGNPINISYNHEFVDKKELFNKAGHKLTLISAVIFKNIRENNQEIFDQFKGNSFLGFLLFLQSLMDGNKAIIIKGVSLMSKNAQISFNVFNAFAIDLKKIINFAVSEGNNLISVEEEHVFMNSIIKNISSRHYLTYKIKGKLYNNTYGDINEIDKLFKKNFAAYSGYNDYLMPLMKASKFSLLPGYYFYRLRRLLNRLVFKK